MVAISSYEREQEEMIAKEGTCKSRKIIGDTIFSCIKQFYHYGRHKSKTGRTW